MLPSPTGLLVVGRLNRVPRLARNYSNEVSQPVGLNSKSPLIRSLPGPSNAVDNEAIRRDFKFWPNFFTEEESSEILKMALWKLDRADSTRRRRRKINTDQVINTQTGLQSQFEGDYGFEEGHYDSVIHDYRETLLSSLPPSPSSSLKSLLARMYSLLPNYQFDPDSLPPQGTSTHLLHLSPRGAILPHVDNLEASGSVILGLSLGAERTMRLKRKDGEGGWELRLPSGSVYLQRNDIRYQYEHSILPYSDEGSKWVDKPLKPGHRVSLMIRNAPTRPASL